jgi:hypothetical protein
MLGRRWRTVPVQSDPTVEIIRSMAKRQSQRVQAEMYAEGEMHGVTLALLAALGDADALTEFLGTDVLNEGIAIYDGPLPDEFKQWARAALARGARVSPKAMAAEIIGG